MNRIRIKRPKHPPPPRPPYYGMSFLKDKHKYKDEVYLYLICTVPYFSLEWIHTFKDVQEYCEKYGISVEEFEGHKPTYFLELE
jgi:hypothetical protein